MGHPYQAMPIVRSIEEIHTVQQAAYCSHISSTRYTISADFFCRLFSCNGSASATHSSQVSTHLSNKPNDFEGHVHNHRGGQRQAD